MAEEKVVYFPVEETEKDASFTRNGKKIFGLDKEDELLLRQVDMELYEICGGGFIYDRRLFPELWWWVFSGFPPYCLSIALGYFMPISAEIFILGVLLCMTLQYVIMLYPLLNSYWYHYRITFQSMGAKGKFMIDLIPALTAAALHLNLLNDDDDKGLWHFLEFNYGYLFLLLGCTAYFSVIVHFMRKASDISGKDVMLGLAMQTFCFMVNGALFVRVIALVFCFGISCYRYMTYSAPPALPPRPKMEESDRLPC